jgi:DNA-3-methyladenine glycosylase I
LQEKIRCSWAGDDPVYCAYHDNEWGIPLHDDKKLFELLILEGFQAGLSWITILQRREDFRDAFANWDWKKISSFGQKEIDSLMQNSGIIRNRLKIRSAINNASRFMEIRKEFGSFDKYLWKFTDFKTVYPDKPYRSWKDVPTSSPLSDSISIDLKNRGFTFTGTVICYSYLQAAGILDDHLENCFRNVKKILKI